MKRFFLSILCAAALMFGYFIFVVLLGTLLHPVNIDTVRTLLQPLDFPYTIYKSIFGLYYGSATLVKVLNYSVALLLYSIPFYVIFTLFAKRKEQIKIQGTESPPEPPKFEF
jgi:hypothetical protein